MIEQEQKAIDYQISVADASEIGGAVLLPHEIRVMVLKKYVKEHGIEALVNLFSQFMGLANSVVLNAHETLELLAIIEADVHPDTAEKINRPTIWGALNGVKLAEGVNQNKVCHGCACRLGSLANQSPSTTCDMEWCLVGDDRFMCHEKMDEQGLPTKRCVGFQAHAKRG